MLECAKHLHYQHHWPVIINLAAAHATVNHSPGKGQMANGKWRLFANRNRHRHSDSSWFCAHSNWEINNRAHWFLAPWSSCVCLHSLSKGISFHKLNQFESLSNERSVFTSLVSLEYTLLAHIAYVGRGLSFHCYLNTYESCVCLLQYF